MGPIFLPGSPAPAGAKDFRMGLFDTIQIGPASGGPGGSMSPPPGKPPSGTPSAVPPVNVFAPMGGGGSARGGPGSGTAVAAMGTILTSAPALRGDVTRAGTMAGSGAMFGTGLPELGVGSGSVSVSGSSTSRILLGDVTRAVATDYGTRASTVGGPRQIDGTGSAGGTSVVGVKGDVTRVARMLDPFRTDPFDHSHTEAIAQGGPVGVQPEGGSFSKNGVSVTWDPTTFSEARDAYNTEITFTAPIPGKPCEDGYEVRQSKWSKLYRWGFLENGGRGLVLREDTGLRSEQVKDMKRDSQGKVVSSEVFKAAGGNVTWKDWPGRSGLGGLPDGTYASYQNFYVGVIDRCTGETVAEMYWETWTFFEMSDGQVVEDSVHTQVQ